MLNVHHLELFYYVAHYKGITEAARHIPYGIQQPAISGQMAQLEGALRLQLFQRRPFVLTPAGARLYEFILPFFSQLDGVEAELRGGEETHLRLAASAAVLTAHLPDLLTGLRHDFPKLRLTLRDASAAEATTLLQRQEIDVALSVLDRSPAPGLKSQELLRLPMVLVVREDFPHQSFKKMLLPTPGGGLVCQAPLISLPEHEVLTKYFQSALAERRISWATRVEVNSIELVQHYTASGFGVGLIVELPAWPLLPGLRKIPLPEFPPLVVGVLTPLTLKPIAARFVDSAKARVRGLQKRIDAVAKQCQPLPSSASPRRRPSPN